MLLGFCGERKRKGAGETDTKRHDWSREKYGWSLGGAFDRLLAEVLVSSKSMISICATDMLIKKKYPMIIDS
jgi:hypothetical protein